MAFHSEIKVNYQVLQNIVSDLKKYEKALQSMQTSIANMDRIISENEGKTFVALGKIEHDFDDEIVKCKEEIRDIYTSISNYVSDMSGIIGASPAGSTVLVDRADIYCNKTSIKNACADIGRIGQNLYGHMVYSSAYEDRPNKFAEMQRDARRTSRMREAIQSSARKIDGYYQAIDNIYKNKIKKYENKDDDHEAKIIVIHDKYTGLKDCLREAGKDIWAFVKGVFNWGKDLIVGVVDLLVLARSVEVYFVYKIVRQDPPDWSKQRVEGLKELKGMTPWNIVESLCQSGSDTLAEKGYAYGLGYVAPDVVITVLGYGAVKNTVKAVDTTSDFTRYERIISNGCRVSNGPGRPIKSIKTILKPHEVVRIKAVYMPSEMRAAIRSAGLSEYSFTKLRLKDVKQLTAEERKALKQIRESVPMPNSDTRMQKIIPIEDVDKYVSGEYSIRGFVSRADDGLFKNPTDAFDSLRLDYKETKFVRRGDSVGIIRYSTAESADAKIPYSPELGGTFEFDSPFTGNGFTKSLNGHIVPEYHTKELEQLNPGSKMYELKTDGTLTEIAEYVKGEVWIRK